MSDYDRIVRSLLGEQGSVEDEIGFLLDRGAEILSNLDSLIGEVDRWIKDIRSRVVLFKDDSDTSALLLNFSGSLRGDWRRLVDVRGRIEDFLDELAGA